MRAVTRSLVAVAALLACSSTPEPTQSDVVVDGSASLEVEAPRATVDAVGVALTSRPRKLVLDGSFDEWGTLPALAPSLAPREMRTVDASPVAPRENPKEARSRVTFAADHDGAALAIQLEGTDEVWVGLGTTPAELPLLGEYFGRMGFVPTNCLSSPRVSQEEGSDSQGYWMEENPPEIVAACEQMLARVAEQQVAHAQRFERWFHIDARGVDVVGLDGKTSPLLDAKVAAGRAGGVRRLEVELPLSAWPRVAEAPLTLVRLAATTKPPANMRPDPSQWVWVEPTRPIKFEPAPEFLAHAFTRAADVGDMPVFSSQFRQPRALSYLPSNTESLELFDSTLCAKLESREVPLYQSLATEGYVEVGLLASPRGSECQAAQETWVAIRREGTVMGIVPLEGRILSTVKRAGEVHVISWYEASWEATAGRFSVLAIAADGSHREAVVPLEGLSVREPMVYWHGVETFQSGDHETFGWKATREDQFVTATFNWDAARKQYRGTVDTKPAKPKNKKAAK